MGRLADNTTTRHFFPSSSFLPPLSPSALISLGTLSGRAVRPGCAFVCVCVCLCAHSRVGASCVGRPICVCAVLAPLRRVNKDKPRVRGSSTYLPTGYLDGASWLALDYLPVNPRRQREGGGGRRRTRKRTEEVRKQRKRKGKKEEEAGGSGRQKKSGSSTCSPSSANQPRCMA